MEQEIVDCPDNVLNDFVYDENNRERETWKFCNSIKLPRSEVVFFVQVTIICSLILVCVLKLFFYKISCEDMPFWTSLLSGVVGYILPSPRL